MKLRTKSIITLIAMLLGGIGQVAAGEDNTPPVKSIIYLLDGKSSTESAAGSITTETELNGDIFKVTLTVTPVTGKTYIEKDNIKVTRTVSGEKAQTRENEPEIDNEPVELTAVDSEADPTGVTKYYFTFSTVANSRGYWNNVEYEYDYEVTADFQSLIDITNATVTLEETSFAYTGEEIKPTVSSVVLGEETIAAENYEVSYNDYIIEPAEATSDNAPTVIVTATKLPYTGDVSKKFTITKATPELKFSKETATATMNAEFEAPTLTVTPEGLEGITYSSSNTNAATIDEDGKVTIVGAGETTIKATFAEDEHYEAAEASYVLTVSKAKTELKFSKKTATATMNAEFEAPTLTKTPEDLEGVEFTSSNTAAATVDKTTGAVTLVAPGETTIKAAFAGSDTYEAAEASYTLTVNRAVGDGYPLWVNGTQVTSDNAEDILRHNDDPENPEKPLYLFNAEKNLLLIDHDQTGETVIESRMDDLYIYLMDVSKIDHIFFNNTGDDSKKGTLTFTTNGNFPGKLVLTNSTKGESAITGFSEIKYKWNLVALEPDGVDYNTTTLQMEYKEKDEDGKETGNILVADNITIGQAIVPITEKKTIRFEESQLVEKDEDGNVKLDENGDPIPADLSNYPYAPSTKSGEPEKNVVLINLNPANIDDTDAGGFDVENGISGIYIVDTMTDDKAGKIAKDVVAQKMVPGGSTYAENYDGFTFIVPAGEGTVEIDEIVDNNHEFHLIIGTNKPITLDKSNSTVRRYDAESQRVQAELYFNVKEPVYCYLYLVKKGAGTRGIGGTRLGKREKAHGKLISLSVSVTRSIPTDPPSEVSGDLDDPEVETGITNVRYEQAVGGDKWYNLKGQQIETPTQKGIYIQNRKKIIIK